MDVGYLPTYTHTHTHTFIYMNTTQVVQELWSLGLTLHMYEAEVANGVVWCVCTTYHTTLSCPCIDIPTIHLPPLLIV